MSSHKKFFKKKLLNALYEYSPPNPSDKLLKENFVKKLVNISATVNSLSNIFSLVTRAH